MPFEKHCAGRRAERNKIAPAIYVRFSKGILNFAYLGEKLETNQRSDFVVVTKLHYSYALSLSAETWNFF